MIVVLLIHYYEKNKTTFFKIEEASEFRTEYPDRKNIRGTRNSAENSNSPFRRTHNKTQSNRISTAVLLHQQDKR
jgi:hypothetical protein